jgi:hypothetical protein
MIEMLPTAPEDKPEIQRIIRLIHGSVEGEDPNIVIQSICFYLFGMIEVVHEQKHGVETVKFCVKYFENYVEQLKWGG